VNYSTFLIEVPLKGRNKQYIYKNKNIKPLEGISLHSIKVK